MGSIHLLTVLLFLTQGVWYGQALICQLSSTEVECLTEIYGLEDSALGPIKEAITFQGSDPNIVSFLLVLNGQCGHWTSFNRDRIYIWHAGKMNVDIITKKGEVTTECLGDPLEDKNCSYVVKLPAGSTISQRIEGYAVFTGIVILDTGATGRRFEFEEMLKRFPNLCQVIERTRPCYRNLSRRRRPRSSHKRQLW